MTIQSLAWSLDQPIPGTAKLVLIALANRADHTTGHCSFDAHDTATESQISEASLWRYIGALERNGYLAQDKKRDGRDIWLQMDREDISPWSWAAEDQNREDGEGDAESASPAPRKVRAGGGAVPAFSRDRQAEARESANAPPPGRPIDQIAIIEGSKAHDAWCRHLRDQHKVPPYVRWIILADGRQAKGFYMPSLFPPRTDGIENLEGAA